MKMQFAMKWQSRHLNMSRFFRQGLKQLQTRFFPHPFCQQEFFWRRNGTTCQKNIFLKKNTTLVGWNSAIGPKTTNLVTKGSRREKKQPKWEKSEICASFKSREGRGSRGLKSREGRGKVEGKENKHFQLINSNCKSKMWKIHNLGFQPSLRCQFRRQKRRFVGFWWVLVSCDVLMLLATLSLHLCPPEWDIGESWGHMGSQRRFWGLPVPHEVEGAP